MAAWRTFSSDINTNQWGKAFRYAKNGKSKERNTCKLVKPDGSQTISIDETASLLLDTFVPSDDNQGLQNWYGPLSQPTTITESDIKKVIWRMKPNRAPGWDGITAGMLRKAWAIISLSITNLFNRCIEEATFPDSWKTARLVVIPKVGKPRSSPKSYRPVRLLPALGKALETIMITNLEQETSLNDIEHQHGFTAGRSTCTAMKQLYSWAEATKSRHVFVLFLDITGAFDNVKWMPIINRLEAMGST